MPIFILYRRHLTQLFSLQSNTSIDAIKSWRRILVSAARFRWRFPSYTADASSKNNIIDAHALLCTHAGVLFQKKKTHVIHLTLLPIAYFTFSVTGCVLFISTLRIKLSFYSNVTNMSCKTFKKCNFLFLTIQLQYK